MSKPKNSKVRKEQAIARMIVVGMDFDTIMKRHNTSLSEIERIINKFKPGEKKVLPELSGVCLGSKRTPYWENEMDYWTGRSLDNAIKDNPFKHLKYEDVMNEKVPEPEIEKLKIEI